MNSPDDTGPTDYDKIWEDYCEEWKNDDDGWVVYNKEDWDKMCEDSLKDQEDEDLKTASIGTPTTEMTPTNYTSLITSLSRIRQQTASVTSLAGSLVYSAATSVASLLQENSDKLARIERKKLTTRVSINKKEGKFSTVRFS